MRANAKRKPTTRLELATLRLLSACSSQLSYVGSFDAKSFLPGRLLYIHNVFTPAMA